MVNYLVALEESDNSKNAFYTAGFLMNKKKDHLFLLHVIQKEKQASAFSMIISSQVNETIQQQEKNIGRAILAQYARLSKTMGIKYTAILAVSNHAGEMICQQAEQRKIDFIFVGRRGLTRIKRLFVGSTSKYVVENASCNVMVVKGEPNNIQIITPEEEKKRKIQEEEKLKKEEQEQEISFQSELDRNIAMLAQETEKKLKLEQQQQQHIQKQQENNEENKKESPHEEEYHFIELEQNF